MSVESVDEKPKRQKLSATPEMLAQRATALEKVRQLNPYREIEDPVGWQRDIRQDRPLPRTKTTSNTSKTLTYGTHSRPLREIKITNPRS